jgi:hypothetical protein
VISIVIPTLWEREQAGWLTRCLQRYAETTSHEFEMIVIRDRPACGLAWNEGIAQARGDYIHLTADDIEPRPGWDIAAIECVQMGALPAARILNANGTLQSCGTDAREHQNGTEASVARIPFGSRMQFEAIGPMMETQYMGDYWFSHRGREVGLRTIVIRNYCFIHHYARQGRIDTLAADEYLFFQRGGEQ